jgi:hypothetical protein
VIHAVAGRNPKALKELQALAEADPRVQAHGFAPLANMMHEADLNVVRTHGTTFAETVAAGKPAVYYGPNVRFGLLQDGQGDLTRRTAIYAGEHVGHPTAIGLDAVPGAVHKAIRNYDSLLERARNAKGKMGDPARDAVRKIMKPREGYGLGKVAAITPMQLREGTPHVGSFEEFRKGLKPGDVILTKPNEVAKTSPQDVALRRTVRFYDAFTYSKHPGWAHTAMYLGDGRIAHLNDHKLEGKQIVPIKGAGTGYVLEDNVNFFKHQGYDLAAVRPKISPEEAQQAVENMRHFAANPRSATLTEYAKNLIRTGFSPSGGRKTTDAVCSGIIGEAYPTRLSDRARFSMRPKDFMESHKVTHVMGYSPDSAKEKTSSMRSLAAQVLGGKNGR